MDNNELYQSNNKNISNFAITLINEQITKSSDSSSGESIDNFENECPICFRIFDYSAKEEPLISFPIENSECKCKQIFHLKCILTWLKKNKKNSCPICNKKIHIKNSNNLIVSSNKQLSESIANIINIENYFSQIDNESGLDIVVHEPNNFIPIENNFIPIENEYIQHIRINEYILGCLYICIYICFLCIISIVIYFNVL